MVFLNNLRISAKIYIGFGIVLALLLVIAATGYFNLTAIGDTFTRYRELALQTNQSGRVQANLLETRLNAKSFLIDASGSNIDKVEERASTTLAMVKELRGLVFEPEKLKLANDAEAAMTQYLQAFEEVTKLQDRRTELLSGILDRTGPKMEQDLTAIMNSAKADGDTEAAYRAGITLRSLLLARLYVTKYLVSHSDETYQRVQKEFTDMARESAAMLASLQNGERQDLARTVNELVDRYRVAFDDLHATVMKQDDIITHTLDKIGPHIASDVEELKLAVKQEQDILGPKAMAAIKTAVMTVIIVSMLGIVIAILASMMIGHGISSPIKAMTRAMGWLAEGDKAVTIPARDHKSEIGDMAAAVVVFRENMIKADKLSQEQREAEKRKQEEAERVRNLIKEFELTIMSVLDNLAAADNSMRQTSASVRKTAEDTKDRSINVAASAEQASQNVQTVSSAAEELAASISEISRQVQQANQVSDKAVREADSTSEQIRILEQNVSKIGEIVSLINDIADQTNLLALNATIEAARAGDAGKGFAVVASEVKSLASQTSRATDEIGSQISEVQTSTNRAVQSIDGISRVIREVSEISASISAAVEEQGAATGEIARNVEEASTGTRNVSLSIAEVLQSAEEANHAANDIAVASTQLSGQSDILKERVTKFLRDVQSSGGGADEIVSWSEDFEFNIEKVDREHRDILNLVNTVYKHVKDGDHSQMNMQNIDRIIKQFSDHFEGEEKYMTSHAYPAFEEHQAAHAKMVSRLQLLRSDVQQGLVKESLELLTLLTHWFQEHHSNDDALLARFFHSHKKAA